MEKVIMNDNLKLPKIVAVLGNFDGIHKGHQLLLHKAIDIAKKEGIKSAIFTFNPHPSFVLSGKDPVGLIYTNEEKEMIMEKEGIDYYIELEFTKESASISSKQFIEDIIIKKLNAQVIVIGSDYRFGKNRSGDYKMLVEYSENHDFDVVVIHKLKYGNKIIGSTWIRGLILEGNLEMANELIGRPFLIKGKVMKGNQIGTNTIGFPTANIIPNKSKLLPPNGVYISNVNYKNRTYMGITNIGVKPTVEGHTLTVETHIIDFNQNIYGEEIQVNLYHYLRPEKKFENIEALRKQISTDIEDMKKYFSK